MSYMVAITLLEQNNYNKLAEPASLIQFENAANATVQQRDKTLQIRQCDKTLQIRQCDFETLQMRQCDKTLQKCLEENLNQPTTHSIPVIGVNYIARD